MPYTSFQAGLAGISLRDLYPSLKVGLQNMPIFCSVHLSGSHLQNIKLINVLSIVNYKNLFRIIFLSYKVAL